MTLQPISMAEPERIWSLVYIRTCTVAYVGSKQRALLLHELKGAALTWVQVATPDHIRRYAEGQQRTIQATPDSGLRPHSPSMA